MQFLPGAFQFISELAVLAEAAVSSSSEFVSTFRTVVSSAYIITLPLFNFSYH
jgi:NADH:ubiquinone oxidoreductase subunit 4 (subunit M)